ncbi:uncharacterized protein LOC111898393 [Lactuca sativa]|uniref:uncharacterized protein LOC111898393 n=1 Tax=Lactuca sativa TaxID=4236 RepID=UPI000CD9B021|nr:uncharacterized protein LOC111898393 [Lactuca sativa]
MWSDSIQPTPNAATPPPLVVNNAPATTPSPPLITYSRRTRPTLQQPPSTTTTPSGSNPLPITSQTPSVPPTRTIHTRSMSGISKPKQHYNLHTSTSISPIPRNPIEALKNPDWNKAMTDEFQALIDNKTWELVPKHNNMNIVRSMWIYRHKTKSDGSLERYKARLVCDGRSQKAGIDCGDTFSPVVKPATIRTVLSLALSNEWQIHQLDVKNAFLHGHLHETVYMHQPPGFRNHLYPNHVCMLKKSLYGLKQAPRAWYQRFADYVFTMGFKHSKCDHSLFVYKKGTHTAFLLLYVDDILLITSSPGLHHKFMVLLAKEFAMKDLGPLSYFLGISVSRYKDSIFLSQQKYATEILERAGMTSCHPTSTPVDSKAKLSSTDGTLLPDGGIQYRQLAGALQYLTFTRPDISYAVQQVLLLTGCIFTNHLLGNLLPIPMPIGQVARTRDAQLLITSLVDLRLVNCLLRNNTAKSFFRSITNLSDSFSVLNINSNDLPNSMIYPWLFNFSSSLTYIDLSNNKLVGIIPEAFGTFKNLQTLDLTNNGLEGGILSSFGELSNLRELSLYANNLNQDLSSFFDNLSGYVGPQRSLQVLDLSQNQLSGSLPDFTTFTALKEFYLFGNQLNGSFPRRFEKISNLSILDLADNQINGLIPDLSALASLRRVYFERNLLHGTLAKRLEPLSMLESLGASSNFFQGTISETHIANISRLTYLDLSNNSLAIEIGSNWSATFQLETISLSSCKLGSSFPGWLRTQTNFSVLNISNAGINDFVPSWFWESLRPGIRYLNPSSNQIHGMIPDLDFISGNQPIIDLSSNNFSGNLPLFPPNKGFIVGIVGGFAFGFWGFYGTLVLKDSWRHAYYGFLNVVKDWVLLRLELSFVRLRRKTSP